MARLNEQAIAKYNQYQEKYNYPALISRGKVREILGCSSESVAKLIAKKELAVDSVTNKVKLMSVAEFECRN